MAGIVGVDVVPFNVVPFSFLADCVDEFTFAFSVLGFGDTTGFGLSDFLGLDLLAGTVVELFVFADSV